METSANSPASHATLLQAGFLAKTSALPERVLVLRARGVDSGANITDSFANFDPDTSSWRTSQRCLVEGWARYSETWPRSGMTRSGTAYRLPTLVPLTAETGFGLWRTPQAGEGNGGGQAGSERLRQGHSMYLRDQILNPKLWPTPHGFSQDGRSNGPSGNELGRAVNQSLWPTPTSTLGSNGGRVTPAKAREGGTLIEALSARTLYPAPDANCWKGGAENQRRGQLNGSLNPTWVEWLMGYPLGWTALEPSEMPSSRRSRK